MGSGRLGAREGQNRLKTWCLPPRGQHAKSLGTHGMQGGRERNSGGILEEGSWGCGLGPGPWRILRPTGRWVWRSILDSQHPLKHRDRGAPGTARPLLLWACLAGVPNSPLTGAPASGPGFQSASSANLAGPRPTRV